MNLTFVLIPGWLEQSLKAANLPLSTALDLGKLASILSKDDVSFYCYTNPILLGMVAPELATDFAPIFLNYSNDETLVRKVNDLAMCQTPVVRENAYASAFAIASEPGAAPAASPQEVDLYNLVELTDNVVGVIPVKASASSTNPSVLKKECLEKAIGFLLRHDTLENIAPKQIFQDYAKLARTVSRLGEQ